MGDMTREIAFTKGHGTENDFVLVPDLDGARELTPETVAALADRRAGIGGDGVIRIVPAASAIEAEVRDQARSARWFMDYRNADGSVAEMCGNGTRVFAAYLRREGLETADEFAIATRAGVKTVRVEGEEFAVDLGPWRLTDPMAAERDGFDALVHVDDGDPFSALSVDLGNPHTVLALPETVDLAAIDLTRAPVVRPTPARGTNVELVRPLGPDHIAMRVHERGVGRPGPAAPVRPRPPSRRASGPASTWPPPPGPSTSPVGGCGCGSCPASTSSWPVPLRWSRTEPSPSPERNIVPARSSPLRATASPSRCSAHLRAAASSSGP